MKTTALLLALAATLHAAPPEPKFRAVTIDDAIQIGYGVAVADVDGDKWPDILLADKKQFVWYRNPGPPKPNATEPAPAPWDKFILSENLTEHDNVCLAAQDIDGDGKCEIAVGAEWNPGDTVNSGAVFYLIPPADRTQKWEPVKFPNVEPTTHRMKWIQVGEKQWGLLVVPLHGRGNKNGEGAPVKVLCYLKPADVRSEWPSEIADESMHMTHNIDYHHYPTHPITQFFLAGKEGVSLITRRSNRWGLKVCASGTDRINFAAGEVRTGEFRSSATTQGWFVSAIEPMHGNKLTVFVNPSSDIPNGEPLRRILTESLVEGHALAAGDLIALSKDQIVVGWRGTPGKEGSTIGVHIWTPLDAEGKEWRDSAVDDGGMACEDLVLADLNGDGKLDIVASGRATHNVKIYFNETPR